MPNIKVSSLRRRFKLLGIAQACGARFDLYSWDHKSKSSVFRDFLELLQQHEWVKSEYRWDIYGEDVIAANEYWSPTAVTDRPPSYSEALKCARFIHRCERISWGTPWSQALRDGVIDWILRGLQLQSTGSHASCEASV
jgi:hypothetical protein